MSCKRDIVTDHQKVIHNNKIMSSTVVETDKGLFTFRKLLVESSDNMAQHASSTVAETSLPVTLLSPHGNSHMAKTFTTGPTVICFNFNHIIQGLSRITFEQ